MDAILSGSWYLAVFEILVGWLDQLVLSGQIDPELEAMGDFVAKRHFTVDNTTSSGHPLQIAWSNRSLVTAEVFVTKTAGQNVGDRLEAAMWVIRKSLNAIKISINLPLV